MQTTTNYNLKKPDVSENYNVEEFNENFEIIDSELKSVAEKAESSAEHPNDTENPHEVTAEQVGLGNVPNVKTNDQTPTYTVATENTALTSGEKLSVAFGKIAKAIKSLISHLGDSTIHHSHEEIQGFVARTTTFNTDGSITETGDFGTKTTTFNTDGSITETLKDSSGTTIATKKTTFSDSVIKEAIS